MTKTIFAKFSCFSSVFSLIAQKTLKKHILTSIGSAQNPDAGQNIQQLLPENREEKRFLLQWPGIQEPFPPHDAEIEIYFNHFLDFREALVKMGM